MYKTDLPTRIGFEIFPQVTYQPGSVKVVIIQRDRIDVENSVRSNAFNLISQYNGLLNGFFVSQRSQAHISGLAQYNNSRPLNKYIAARYTLNSGQESMFIYVYPDGDSYTNEEFKEELELPTWKNKIEILMYPLLVFYGGNRVAAFNMPDVINGVFKPVVRRELKQSSWGSDPLPTIQFKCHKDRMWFATGLEYDKNVFSSSGSHNVHVIDRKDVLASAASSLGSLYAPVAIADADVFRMDGQAFTYGIGTNGPEITVSGTARGNVVSYDASGNAYSEFRIMAGVCSFEVRFNYLDPYEFTAESSDWGYVTPSYNHYELDWFKLTMKTVNGSHTTSSGSTAKVPYVAVKHEGGLDVCVPDTLDAVLQCDAGAPYRASITVAGINVSTTDLPNPSWCTGAPYQFSTNGTGESMSLVPFPYPLINEGSETKLYYVRSDITVAGGTWNVVTPYETMSGEMYAATNTPVMRTHKNDNIFINYDEYSCLVYSGTHNWAPELGPGTPCTAYEGHIKATGGIVDMGLICDGTPSVYCCGNVKNWAVGTTTWYDSIGDMVTLSYVPFTKPHMVMCGWLQISDGKYMIQGYAAGMDGDPLYDRRAFVVGSKLNIIPGIAGALGVSPTDIQTMLLNIPLEFIEKIK